MGFFSPSVTCNICGEKAGLNRFKIQDGWICRKCFKKCGFNLNTPIMQFDTERIKSTLHNDEKNKEELSTFNATKSIGSFMQFDENQRKIKIVNSTQGQKIKFQIYNYADILSCELLEDDVVITKGGFRKDSVNNLGVKITVNDLTNPTVYIQLLYMKTQTSSVVYKNARRFADDILSAVSIVINENIQNIARNQEVSQQGSGAATEIKKFKELLDEGIITQEEFEAKKKQLLGI